MALWFALRHPQYLNKKATCLYDEAEDVSAGSLWEPLTPESQGKERKPNQHFQHKGMEDLFSAFLSKGQQGHSAVTKTTMEMLSTGEDRLLPQPPIFISSRKQTMAAS